MRKDELRNLYWKDPQSACWHWTGGPKVRYNGRIYYPARLLWELVRKQTLDAGISLARTCTSEDCVNPEHRNLVSKDTPIKTFRYSSA